MREIEFRAKAINREEGQEYRTNYKNGDWVYGLITKRKDKYCCAIMTNTNGVSNIDVDDKTIGQYVGVKDSKGVKAYEGDIVKNSIGMLFVIKYFCGGFDLIPTKEYNKLKATWNCLGELQNALYFKESCKIVGNIYDTPELLKVECLC